jgi:hypothetical protein
MHLFALFLFLSVASLFNTNYANAKEFRSVLKVSDCKGSVRLTQPLDESRNVSLLFELDTKLPLEHEAILQTIDVIDAKITGQSDSERQKIVFGQVSAGNWKLCNSDGQDLDFSSVRVLGTEAAGASILGTSTNTVGATTIGATALAIGGVVAAGSSGAFDGGSSSRELSGALNPASVGSVVLDPVTLPNNNANSNENFDFGAPGAPLSPFQ